jgi:hypothetical protein
MVFVAPNLALTSSMACRVFRGLRLGFIADFDDGNSKIATIQFARPMNDFQFEASAEVAISKVVRSRDSRFGENRDPERQVTSG